MKVAVIGSGVYGNSIAKLLLKGKNEVVMWTDQKDLTGVICPEGVNLTNSFSEAIKGVQVCFVLTGSKFVRSVLEGLKPFIRDDVLLVLGSKGILDEGTLMSDIAESVLPNNPLSVISGPTFAKDIGNLEPVGFTIASKDIKHFELIKSIFEDVYLEHSFDLRAIELASTLKNAYAIGSGILEGLGYHNSTKCLFITKALYEINEIFKSLNLDRNSSITLAGIGDLVLTCSSTDSRNFTYGTLLAKSKEEASDYIAKTTVEGHDNIKTFNSLFSAEKVDAPILECIYNIIIENDKPQKLIEQLLK